MVRSRRTSLVFAVVLKWVVKNATTINKTLQNMEQQA